MTMCCGGYRLVRLFDPQHTGRFEYHRFAAQVYRHAGVRNVASVPPVRNDLARRLTDEDLAKHKDECELEPPITVGNRFNFDFSSPTSRIPEEPALSTEEKAGNILATGSFARLPELESSTGELVAPPPTPPLRPGVVDKEAAIEAAMPMTTEMELVEELDSNGKSQL